MTIMKKSADEGLSLIELIIVIVILGILGLVMGTIFGNTWRAQEAVRLQTQATSRGQLVASEIERAMRNAIAFDVSADGSTLRVNSSFTGGHQCQAFSLASDGAHMTVTSAPAAPSGWPTWQSDIAPISGSPFFSSNGGTVTYAFDSVSRATDGSIAAAPVRFTGKVFMRNTGVGTLSPCW
ncbi:prepilin-type N-terminal cleavage/methylation domain-containing protein [Microbacterium sp. 13-71-7]|jgi:prepilin-type N-terminal cleavage/methylation domain-containing protein|uniref:prepilin-type N-terminal cleavage/methylation domain-containing protein n=1 Tax=Microbacterium sp. 13-71-7 TaxID=1970399 RepID=UPI000BCC9D09|nr:prepilin-type N-terminal cleavage/methylation domain-containing protein [Microbacterium sp. 13-71-7]OZB83382.1 MAG: hypothetical protein B7X32_10510 [Microbacterium sp. 13-71-7]